MGNQTQLQVTVPDPVEMSMALREIARSGERLMTDLLWSQRHARCRRPGCYQGIPGNGRQNGLRSLPAG